MSGCIQIELWGHEYEMEALSSVLAEQGTTVEQRMQELLTGLYEELVPAETQREIRARLNAERAAWEAEQEAARVFSAFNVRENGREEFFRLDRGLELLNAAQYLRRYLRREPGADAAAFAELFPARESITAEAFDRLVALRMENTGKVTGAFELDFDRREFSAVHVIEGWKTFAMGDVSAAAYRAFRGDGLSPERRLERLLDRLDGREIASAGHLSARDISLAEEICEMDGQRLNFYLETGFDVDAVFGTDVRAAGNGDTLNVYAGYDMASGQVCDTLEADLRRADGRVESLEYRLNAAEKEVLLRKMEDYCLRQTGQTLAEYSARRMAEEPAPTTQTMM